MLFTHRGCSGPAILNASLYWQKGIIEVDFMPRFDLNKIKDKNKQLTTLLPLPKRFTKEFLKSLGLNDKKFKEYNKSELKKIRSLKNYHFAPAGTFGFKKAEITKGGVDLSQINPQTFESKLQKGLYFCGEVLDISGEVGGYNIQFACSSAMAIAKDLKSVC